MMTTELKRWQTIAAQGIAIERELRREIKRLRASEQAWKIIAKQNDKWNALPKSEKEAALQKALDEAIAENMTKII